jgi:hypothetical protein
MSNTFISFFIWQPVHIWAISALFGVLFLVALLMKNRYSQIRCLPPLIAFLAWLAYGFWERKAAAQKWDIRVDLLFGWPLLFGGTAIVVVLFVQSVIRARKSDEREQGP